MALVQITKTSVRVLINFPLNSKLYQYATDKEIEKEIQWLANVINQDK